jgi:hypothetical protein
MTHAIIRGKNGRRHEVDFGDAPVRVEVHASEETVEIFVEADFETHAEGRRRFAILNIPRHLFSEATGEAARRASRKEQCLVRALLTSTVVAAAMALAGCTSDGTPASTENSGTIASFVRNLFGAKSEDQPVEHAVAAAEAHPTKLRAQPANKKTAIALVPKPSAKRQASAEPQTTPESTTPPLLSGAAPTVPVGSFDNRFSSSH